MVLTSKDYHQQINEIDAQELALVKEIQAAQTKVDESISDAKKFRLASEALATLEARREALQGVRARKVVGMAAQTKAEKEEELAETEAALVEAEKTALNLKIERDEAKATWREAEARAARHTEWARELHERRRRLQRELAAMNSCERSVL